MGGGRYHGVGATALLISAAEERAFAPRGKSAQHIKGENMSEILRTGAPAPDFQLPSSPTGETVRLADLKGKNVVLFFYPMDDTPG